MLRVMDGGLKASIHRVNWEQAYLPLARTQRASAKVLVDGAGARVAEATAALILLAWLQLVVGGGSVVGRSTSWITVLLVAALAAWVGLTQVLVRRLRAAAVADATDEMRIAIPLPDS
jgi:ATP/ADP translocase